MILRCGQQGCDPRAAALATVKVDGIGRNSVDRTTTSASPSVFHLMRIAPILLLLTSLGCASEAPRTRSPGAVRIDRNRCIHPSGTGATVDVLARRCAELFVIRNGYTDFPPVADSSQWVPEFMELGVAARRHMLQRRAIAVCDFARRADAVSVIFEYDSTFPLPKEGLEDQHRAKTGRAVEVGDDGSLALVHQDVFLPDTSNQFHEGQCRRIAHAAPDDAR